MGGIYCMRLKKNIIHWIRMCWNEMAPMNVYGLLFFFFCPAHLSVDVMRFGLLEVN